MQPQEARRRGWIVRCDFFAFDFSCSVEQRARRDNSFPRERMHAQDVLNGVVDSEGGSIQVVTNCQFARGLMQIINPNGTKEGKTPGIKKQVESACSQSMIDFICRSLKCLQHNELELISFLSLIPSAGIRSI
jgi:hypothetical protein